MAEKTMTRIERNERERKLRKAKAIAITVILLAACVLALAVLYMWERRGFEVFLWAFGVIGFARVMMVLATWIDDLTIDNIEPLTYRDYAERSGK